MAERSANSNAFSIQLSNRAKTRVQGISQGYIQNYLDLWARTQSIKIGGRAKTGSDGDKQKREEEKLESNGG